MNNCFNCGQKFNPTRSDQMYCCKHCRLQYYKSFNNKRSIKCFDCSNRSDKYGKCELGERFNGKTHPKNCPIIV